MKSRQKWLNLGVALGFIDLLLNGFPAARAGSFESAQAELSKAYNNYYEALRNSPDPSKDAAKLSKQILQPAQTSMRKAMKEQTAQTVRNVQADPRNGLGPVMKTSADGKSKPPVDEPEESPVRNPKAAEPVERTETVIDGSDVPRELEFPGVKTPSPSPAARSR